MNNQPRPTIPTGIEDNPTWLAIYESIRLHFKQLKIIKSRSEPVGFVRPRLSTDAELLSVDSKKLSTATLLCQSQGFPKPVTR